MTDQPTTVTPIALRRQYPAPYGLPIGGRVLLPNGRYMRARAYYETLAENIPDPYARASDESDLRNEIDELRADLANHVRNQHLRRAQNDAASGRLRSDAGEHRVPDPDNSARLLDA